MLCRHHYHQHEYGNILGRLGVKEAGRRQARPRWRCGRRARRRACCRRLSAWTRARPSLRPRRPTCTRPTTATMSRARPAPRRCAGRPRAPSVAGRPGRRRRRAPLRRAPRSPVRCWRLRGGCRGPAIRPRVAEHARQRTASRRLASRTRGCNVPRLCQQRRPHQRLHACGSRWRRARHRAARCVRRATHRAVPPQVLILGGGPNRIGQGIEFDYCCCHASFALRCARPAAAAAVCRKIVYARANGRGVSRDVPGTACKGCP